jgi:FixJ family two-component response regulator
MDLVFMVKPPIVAIIDDDLGLLNAVNRLLSSHGYETEIYASAGALLEAATTTAATCFLIDIQLGDRCGFELARELGDLGVNHPIIFMTANDSKNYERRAAEAGCAAFLRKPFSPESLIDALVNLPGPRAQEI